jgi:hypothetical protein
MSETVTYAGSATVAGGPQVAFTFNLIAEGYSKFNITVPKKTSKALDLKLKTLKVALILIKSTAYSDKLKVDPGGGALALDAPMIIGGTGAVSLLGGVNTLTFDNQLDDPVTIDVFVARGV